MDRYARARRKQPQPRPARSALGYWVPLVLTVTIATAGLAAWIWSERQQDDSDDEHDNDNNNNNNDNRYRRQTSAQESDSSPPDLNDAPPPYPPSESRGSESHQGFLARMSRRTPSPQQFLDNAGQRIAAGVAAAGAAVGLSSVRESDRDVAFSDHEGWNEEAENRRSRAAQPSKSRKTVAVVLNAHPSHQDEDEESDYRTEHASILSHLPQHFNPDTTRLFVLIHTHHLTSLPTTSSPTLAASSNLSSSYTAVSRPLTPTSSSSPELLPSVNDSSTRYFDTLHQQALTLVDRPSMILPFSTPTGYLHLLRHLAPSLVYLADTPELSGAKGENVAQLKGWVGQTILVVGDDGHGGLVDTETETEDEGVARSSKWWEDSSMIGLGKELEVVDADRVGDDWRRRVNV